MNKEYWKKGLLHREDGPAIHFTRLKLDYEEYWCEGQLHREDGPAVVHARVREEWFKNNQRHRVDGPAISIKESVKLPLLDQDFNIVPKLCTDLYPWNEFPNVGKQRIPKYLDAIFGKVHPFTTYGDFGAMPSVMVEKLGIKDLDLKDVRYRVSYDNTRWKERLWIDGSGDNSEMNRDDNDRESSPGRNGGKSGDNPEMDRNDDGPGIFDLLGRYNCEGKVITLFIPSISECAARLDRIPNIPCGPSVMTLTTLVFLHELGHAIHHALRLQKCSIPVNGHDLGRLGLAETVAQHFMMTCIRAHGVRAELIEEQLERGQPRVYSAWRKCGFDTTWDGCRQLLNRA